MRNVVCLTALFALVICSCSGGDRRETGWSDTIAVEAVVVGDSESSTDRNYVGSIGSEREVSLSFAMGGRLTRVAVRNGEHVVAGQVLAEVDATRARSLHAASLATLRQAEDAYRRMEAVHKEGGISEVRWMEMVTDLEKARQAETSSRKQLEDCTLRAPYAGVVSCGDHHEGQEMKPGEAFCSVLDMERLRVNFSVPEQEIALIAVGDEAKATVSALGDRELRLRVADKGMTANPMGHTYAVHATVTGGERKGLLPDMVTKVHATLGDGGGMAIPMECVQTMPEGTIVWVVKNGRAEQRRIVVGDFFSEDVYVESGLAPGDTVVAEGRQKLYSGAKVKSRRVEELKSRKVEE